MGLSHSPSIVTDNLALCLDAANIRSYPGSGSTWYDLSGNGRNFILRNSSYYSFSSNNGGYIDLDRYTPPTSETGGYANYTGTGDLTSANYLLNDHSTEIWVNIDNVSPTSADSTETHSALFVYRGYHSMFYYNDSQMRYTIWSNSPISSQTIAHSAPEQGVWIHYTVTRNGNVLTMYKNGESVVSDTISTPNPLYSVSSEILIGRASTHGSTYTWPADFKVASARMYKKALTPDEVRRNYLATKSRFNL